MRGRATCFVSAGIKLRAVIWSVTAMPKTTSLTSLWPEVIRVLCWLGPVYRRNRPRVVASVDSFGALEVLFDLRRRRPRRRGSGRLDLVVTAQRLAVEAMPLSPDWTMTASSGFELPCPHSRVRLGLGGEHGPTALVEL